jgi:hypothetical protein
MVQLSVFVSATGIGDAIVALLQESNVARIYFSLTNSWVTNC